MIDTGGGAAGRMRCARQNMPSQKFDFQNLILVNDRIIA